MTKYAKKSYALGGIISLLLGFSFAYIDKCRAYDSDIWFDSRIGEALWFFIIFAFINFGVASICGLLFRMILGKNYIHWWFIIITIIHSLIQVNGKCFAF